MYLFKMNNFVGKRASKLINIGNAFEIYSVITASAPFSLAAVNKCVKLVLVTCGIS